MERFYICYCLDVQNANVNDFIEIFLFIRMNTQRLFVTRAESGRLPDTGDLH